MSAILTGLEQHKQVQPEIAVFCRVSGQQCVNAVHFGLPDAVVTCLAVIRVLIILLSPTLPHCIPKPLLIVVATGSIAQFSGAASIQPAVFVLMPVALPNWMCACCAGAV